MNKRLAYLVIAIVLMMALVIPVSAQMGIGTSNPDPSAALDIVSTNQGVLHPRLTTAQRDAISSPAEGLTIYNTTDSCLQVYDGSGWNCAVGGSGIPAPTTSDSGVTTFSLNGEDGLMKIKATLPFNDATGFADMAWLDNNRFVVVESYRYYPVYSTNWDYIATIYDADYHQLAQFPVPVPGTIISETSRPLMVERLSNGNLIFVGEGATAGLGVVITTDQGVEVTPWHNISPDATGYFDGDLVVLDNGNVVVSSRNGANGYPVGQPRQIILDQDGNFVGNGAPLSIGTNLNSNSYGIAATSFGFATLFAAQNGSASVILALYDFTGNLLAQLNLDTDSNNPFGPATVSSGRGVALTRVEGNVLYVGVRRHRENIFSAKPNWYNPNPDTSALPIYGDHDTSGLRKVQVSADGVITTLHEIELSKREIGIVTDARADQFAALPDGRLFAAGTKLPDFASLEFRGNTAFRYGQAFPLMDFGIDGNLSDITNIVLDDINQNSNIYSPPTTWVDFATSDLTPYPTGGGTYHRLLASPDGQRLLVQMVYYGADGGGTNLFTLLFDLSSGELVPIGRTLFGNNTSQWLPKTFSIFALQEAVQTVEIAIVSGTGSGDVLACPACEVSGSNITSSYDSGTKTLTLTATSLAVLARNWPDKLRFLTFAPDGAGTRTFAVTVTNAYGDSYTETFDFAVDAAP